MLYGLVPYFTVHINHINSTKVVEVNNQQYSKFTNKITYWNDNRKVLVDNGDSCAFPEYTQTLCGLLLGQYIDILSIYVLNIDMS